MTSEKRSAEEHKKIMSKVSKFRRQNRKVDLKTADFLNTAQIKQYNWKGLYRDREAIVAELKSWQRLLRVLPEDDTRLIKRLLRHGLTSALQIAAMPREEFKRNYIRVFKKDEALLEETHKRARAIRSKTMLMYIDRVQNREPHFRRLNTAR